VRRGLDLPVDSGGYLNRPGNSEVLEPPAQRLNVARIPYDDQLRCKFKDLLGKQLNILTSGEGDDVESVSRVFDD
jgi:hypothetical protein